MLDIDLSRLLAQLTYIPHSPMIFSSGLFLFLFLIFTFVYWKLEQRQTLRLLFVTAFSYYFYYKSSGTFFWLLALITCTDFNIAQEIARVRHRDTHAKALVALSVLIDLSLLCYFKYTNFLGSIFIRDWYHIDIFLPVGISFFTFQSLSYTIDVYRGKIKPLHSLLDYAFYVSFFPQLVAGPIVRATDFIPQIRKKIQITNAMFGEAIFLIVAGLFKKAVISDYISVNFVERIFDQPTLYSGVENLLGVYGYTLQIYCDFSGYSDMAIGIALMLGFRFPKNFDSPYKSGSITEFWRRWHISLSSWLKDYLYISLGGNRHGKLRRHINLMLTMLFGGLWHGASLNFILWGGCHGLLLCLDKLWHSICPAFSPISTNQTPSRLCRCLGSIITFHLVATLWVLFRAPDFQTASDVFSQIFTQFHPQVFTQWIASYVGVATLMFLGYTLHFVPQRLSDTAKNITIRMPLPLQALLIIALAWLIIQIKTSNVQPFIYFQF